MIFTKKSLTTSQDQEQRFCTAAADNDDATVEGNARSVELIAGNQATGAGTFSSEGVFLSHQVTRSARM